MLQKHSIWQLNCYIPGGAKKTHPVWSSSACRFFVKKTQFLLLDDVWGLKIGKQPIFFITTSNSVSEREAKIVIFFVPVWNNLANAYLIQRCQREKAIRERRQITFTQFSGNCPLRFLPTLPVPLNGIFFLSFIHFYPQILIIAHNPINVGRFDVR